MHFPALLTALFIDQVLWNGSPYRKFRWLRTYLAWWLRLPLIKPARNSGWLGLFPLLPLIALLGWLQFTLLSAWGPVAEFGFGALILLFSLGPRDASRDVEQFLDALNRGDFSSAEGLLDIPADTDQADLHSLSQRMSDTLLIAVCDRYIGPIFWFAVLGPVGAASYRLAERIGMLVPDRHQAANIAHDRLFPLLNWIPVRLTAAGFAIAGNFDAVAAAWKQCTLNEGDCPGDNELLLSTGHAALESNPENNPVEHIEDTLALGWRSLTLWVSILGIAWLLSLL